jgi:hypothetical protein
VNIQAGIETNGGLRIQAYARNLFDDKTPVGILRYIDRGPGWPRRPPATPAVPLRSRHRASRNSA